MDAFLNKHDTFLFDLDGVVWTGPRGDTLLAPFAPSPLTPLTPIPPILTTLASHLPFVTSRPRLLLSHHIRRTPNVGAAIELLRSLGKTLAFITNNSTRSRWQYLTKFHDLGLVSVRLEEIFTCGSASATYLRDVVLPSLPPEQRGIYVM